MKKIHSEAKTFNLRKYNLIKNFSAFTLAEILIVLGIIGIIADMTIQVLKRDVDKIIYVTQLKKFYSTFNQRMQILIGGQYQPNKPLHGPRRGQTGNGKEAGHYFHTNKLSTQPNPVGLVQS